MSPNIGDPTKIKDAYVFLIDFLEAFSQGTGSFVNNGQASLRLILEAAKASDDAVEAIFREHTVNVTSPEFLAYLDSEIERTMDTPGLHSILVAVKLRALDEVGKRSTLPIDTYIVTYAVDVVVFFLHHVDLQPNNR